MTEINSKPSPALARPVAGTVNRDLPGVRCSYKRRGRPANGRGPESGQDARPAIHGLARAAPGRYDGGSKRRHQLNPAGLRWDCSPERLSIVVVFVQK
jgi:hypothetical protein